MANSDDYDRLLKEKGSWTSSRKQLEEELLEAKKATDQAIQERDIARATTAQHATKIDEQIASINMMGQELETLRNSDDQLRNDNTFLTSKVQRLTQETLDLDGQLGEMTGERDEALPDAKNVDTMKEGLLKQIADLEAKYLTPSNPNESGKRQRVD
ncbi:unnamed protein product [Calypogeia fissa]